MSSDVEFEIHVGTDNHGDVYVQFVGEENLCVTLSPKDAKELGKLICGVAIRVISGEGISENDFK